MMDVSSGNQDPVQVMLFSSAAHIVVEVAAPEHIVYLLRETTPKEPTTYSQSRSNLKKKTQCLNFLSKMCIFNLLKALVYIENALGELLLFLRGIKMMKNVVKSVTFWKIFVTV